MTRTGSAAASVRLTFGRLVAYSTNQLPLNMAALPVVLNVSHFYGEVLRVPLGIMGLIFIAARVIDAIQDPVIGLISDKFTHRGPRGRLTFVALMLPLMIGGFYMLFHPPQALFTDSAPEGASGSGTAIVGQGSPGSGAATRIAPARVRAAFSA